MTDKTALILVALSIWSVSTTFAQTEYTADGEPTALEEEIRWLLNRGRFNSDRENQTWSTAYTDIPAAAAPLAPHHSITLAARHHSEDMARNNLFQHATIPGSTYYNAVTQPSPWDRMRAEGYDFNSAAENIAAGYGSAKTAYIGWWNSEGHRLNMFKSDHREIGNGYFNWPDSRYSRYYTMDLGRAGSTHFFTGTLFHDANSDGAYNQGEGRAGIRVLLQIGGAPHAYFDVSSSTGSFAIPIASIADGTEVQVHLLNSTDSTVSISLPQDYDHLSEFTLSPNQAQLVGIYLQPTSSRNVGFRDLAAPPLVPDQPLLTVTRHMNQIQLRWPSFPGTNYRVQYSSDCLNWNHLITAPLIGTGGELTISETAQPQTWHFYRLIAE